MDECGGLMEFLTFHFLQENDRNFTCFVTPWDRYRYLVAPQGYLASGDGVNQRYITMLADFHNKVQCECTWTPLQEMALY